MFFQSLLFVSFILGCWLFFFTIFAASAFAVVVTFDFELIALTICFLTTRFLTSTAFAVLQLTRAFSQLLIKSLGVSLEDLCSRLLNITWVLVIIAAVSASTLRSALLPSCKAFTVHFETLCPSAVTPAFCELGRFLFHCKF